MPLDDAPAGISATKLKKTEMLRQTLLTPFH